MQKELHALLLDVDGTLADTEDVHRQAFNAAFAAAGLEWVWNCSLYKELLAVTGGKERIRYFLKRKHPDFVFPKDGDAFIAALHASKTQFYVDALASGSVPLRPGVERLLVEARSAGLRLAIITTTTPDNVAALLEHSFTQPVTDWFEVIAAGTIVLAKKPAPDIYYAGLEQLDLSADACLAIEDSINGLQSARAAGVTTLITVNDWTRQQDFSGAAAVLDHLGEPGIPCQLLNGDCSPDGLVDVGYLACLHQQAC